MRDWLLALVGCLVLVGCGGSRSVSGVIGRDAVVGRLADLGFSVHKDETIYGLRIIECRKQDGEVSLIGTATDHTTMVAVSVPVDATEDVQRIQTAIQSAESVVDSIAGDQVCKTLYAKEHEVDSTGGVPRASYEMVYQGRKISASRYLSVPKGAHEATIAMFFVTNGTSLSSPSGFGTEATHNP